MECGGKFDTKHAYEPNINKIIGSLSPNKMLVVGFTVYWDLIFKTAGNYDLFLECHPVGSTTIEFGYVLPGEKVCIAGSIILPKRSIVKSFKLGVLNIPKADTYPVFIKITKSSGRLLLINTISLTGPNEVGIVELKDIPTARYIHHAAAAYSRAYFKTKNPQFMYREFIATDWKPNTFTTIAFNGGYVGIVVGQSTGMSIWNAPSGVPNIILETGENVKTKTYDHEGCGTQFSMPYKVKEGVRYGYMLRIEHIQKNSEFPNGVTDYSSWFIDLENNSSLETTEPNKKWLFIGKVRRFCLNNFGEGDKMTTFSSVSGFIENPSTSNGHLYTRKVAVGNSWASVDGISWDASISETYTTKHWESYCGASGGPYDIYPNDFIEYAIGGRIRCHNKGSYTLSREAPKNPPTHIMTFAKECTFSEKCVELETSIPEEMNEEDL